MNDPIESSLGRVADAAADEQARAQAAEQEAAQAAGAAAAERVKAAQSASENGIRTALDDDEPRPSDLVKDTLPDQARPAPAIAKPTQDDLVEALREVVDPELGVNVVDLGMVADILIDDEANVVVDMVPTSPTCPMTDRLEFSMEMATEGMVNSLTVNWLWLEVWTPDRLSEDGREQLRAFGLNI